MEQCFRVIIALLVIGFSSTYYFAESVDISPTLAPLSFEEFRGNRTLVARYTQGAAADYGEAVTLDIDTAYATYLSEATASREPVGVTRHVAGPAKNRLRQLYRSIGDWLPTRMTKRLAGSHRLATGGLRTGMLVFAAACTASMVGFHLLSLWLKGKART